MDQPFSPSEISRQIYQALLAAQATPSLLSPKARSVDWRSPEKQAWFLQKFVGWIQDVVTVEALRDRVRQAMTLFFSPEYFAGAGLYLAFGGDRALSTVPGRARKLRRPQHDRPFAPRC